MEVVGVAGLGHSVAQGARSSRSRRRGNASNVILITETRPRRLDGYQIVCTVDNRSSVGVSGVVIRLRMAHGADLELRGVRTTEAVVRARQAIGAQSTLGLPLPHIARLNLDSFDIDSEGGSGFSASLYWRDEDGKFWVRQNADPARRCKARDLPPGSR